MPKHEIEENYNLRDHRQVIISSFETLEEAQANAWMLCKSKRIKILLTNSYGEVITVYEAN